MKPGWRSFNKVKRLRLDSTKNFAQAESAERDRLVRGEPRNVRLASGTGLDDWKSARQSVKTALQLFKGDHSAPLQQHVLRQPTMVHVRASSSLTGQQQSKSCVS